MLQRAPVGFCPLAWLCVDDYAPQPLLSFLGKGCFRRKHLMTQAGPVRDPTPMTCDFEFLLRPKRQNLRLQWLNQHASAGPPTDPAPLHAEAPRHRGLGAGLLQAELGRILSRPGQWNACAGCTTGAGLSPAASFSFQASSISPGRAELTACKPCRKEPRAPSRDYCLRASCRNVPWHQQ